MYYYNQRGWGIGCGYYNPCQQTTLPTLYIQQAPVTKTTTDALSTITNTDTSSAILNQKYGIKLMNSNRGETNSHELYDNVVFYDTDMRNHNINCNTLICKTNIINQITAACSFSFSSFSFLTFYIPTGWGSTQGAPQ